MAWRIAQIRQAKNVSPSGGIESRQRVVHLRHSANGYKARPFAGLLLNESGAEAAIIVGMSRPARPLIAVIAATTVAGSPRSARPATAPRFERLSQRLADFEGLQRN